MITGIVLENFKCFERVEIHPRRITCFVGANGTGKSSVLQAFGLLKQRAWEIENKPDTYNGRSLILNGPLVTLKNQREIFRNFELRPRVSIKGYFGVNREEHPFSYSRVFSYGGISDGDQEVHDSNVFHSLLVDLIMVPGIRGLTLPSYKLGDDKAFDIAMEDGLSNQEKQIATNLAYSQSDVEKISPMLKRVTGVPDCKQSLFHPNQLR